MQPPTNSASAGHRLRLYDARVQLVIYLFVILSTVGPYNGINALGGAGMKDHLLATKMNSLYAFSFAVCGWLGGAAFNYAGARIVCCIGALCYFCYIAGLTAVALGLASPTLVIPVGILLGVGASFIWSAFGVFSIRYPRAVHQATVFQWMWAFVNLGGSSIGLASLLLNLSGSSSTEANPGSYVALCTITLVGSLLAAAALVHQKNVVKSDGHHVESHSCPTVKKALSDAVAAIGHPQMKLLLPLFAVPAIHMPFLFNGINSQFFNIRSRSLNSCLYWLFRVPGGFIFHGLVRFSRRRHPERRDPCIARSLLPGFYFTYLWVGVCLLLAYASIYNVFGILDPPQSSAFALDFYKDARHSVLPSSLFIMFGLADSLVQSFIYSLLASLAGANTEEAAVFSGFYKSLQSLGLGLFWMLDWQCTGSIPHIKRYKIHWWLVLLVWISSFPGALLTLLRVRVSLGPQEEENSFIECTEVTATSTTET